MTGPAQACVRQKSRREAAPFGNTPTRMQMFQQPAGQQAWQEAAPALTPRPMSLANPLPPFHSAFLPTSPTPSPSSYTFPLFLLPLLHFSPTLSLEPCPFPSLPCVLSPALSVSFSPTRVWTFRGVHLGRRACLAVSGSFSSRQNVPKERGGREESYLRMHSIVILPPFDRWTEKEKIISPLNSWNSQDTEMK